MDWISSWKVTGMFLDGIFLIFSTLNKIQSFFLAPQEAKHSVQEFALSTPSLVQTHPLDWMRCSSSDKIWSLWKKPVWTQFLEVYYNFSYGSCQGNVWSPAKLHTDPPSLQRASSLCRRSYLMWMWFMWTQPCPNCWVTFRTQLFCTPIKILEIVFRESWSLSRRHSLCSPDKKGWKCLLYNNVWWPF